MVPFYFDSLTVMNCIESTKKIVSYYFDEGIVLLADEGTGFTLIPFFFNNSFPYDNFNVANAFPDDSDRRKTSFVCMWSD